MLHIPLSRKHNTIPRNSRNLHRVIPCFCLFPGIFHQGFLGQTSTRRGSRKEKIPQPRISFLRGCNMDLHRCLHLVGIDTQSLYSEVLRYQDDARNLRSGCAEPANIRSAMALLESVVHSCHYCGIFMVHFDCAGEEGDLATWKAVPAKACYSMVSLTLKIDAILPNPDVFATNRNTIGHRYPFVFFLSIGMVPMSLWIWTTEMTMWYWQNDLWTADKIEDFLGDALTNDTQISFSFGQVCFFMTILVSSVELTQIP